MWYDGETHSALSSAPYGDWYPRQSRGNRCSIHRSCTFAAVCAAAQVPDTPARALAEHGCRARCWAHSPCHRALDSLCAASRGRRWAVLQRKLARRTRCQARHNRAVFCSTTRLRQQQRQARRSATHHAALISCQNAESSRQRVAGCSLSHTAPSPTAHGQSAAPLAGPHFALATCRPRRSPCAPRLRVATPPSRPRGVAASRQP